MKFINYFKSLRDGEIKVNSTIPCYYKILLRNPKLKIQDYKKILYYRGYTLKSQGVHINELFIEADKFSVVDKTTGEIVLEINTQEIVQ